MAPATSESTSTGKASGTTVRFNVGGTVYEVSRSLLNQHPDTMLARLASDTWQSVGNEDDDDKDDGNDAIFIERNGERFQYCLDYMRDGGTVGLPATVSEQGFLQDLAYYGFQDVEGSKTAVTESFHYFPVCTDHVQSILNAWSVESECMDIARHCLCYYAIFGKLENIPTRFDFPREATWCPRYTGVMQQKLIGTMNKVSRDGDYEQKLNQYLKPFGLKWESWESWKSDSWGYITLERL